MKETLFGSPAQRVQEYGYDPTAHRTDRIPVEYAGWAIPGYSAKVHFFKKDAAAALCGLKREHESTPRLVAYPDLGNEDEKPTRCPRCAEKLARLQRKAGA